MKYTQRQVSCAHRYGRQDWSCQKNLKVYGEDDSKEGMGHNLGVLVCGVGEVQTSLNQLCRLLDHQFLNSITEHIVPTVEAIARFCFETLQEASQEGIEFVQIQQGEGLWSRYTRNHQATLTKVYRFSCLHRHYNSDLSDEKNKALFGKCSHVHGHEYKLEVTLRGAIHRETYLICERKWMDSLVDRLITQPFHKSFLNDFMDNASGEIIIQRIYDILRASLPQSLELGLCLRETQKNSFFVGFHAKP